MELFHLCETSPFLSPLVSPSRWALRSSPLHNLVERRPSSEIRFHLLSAFLFGLVGGARRGARSVKFTASARVLKLLLYQTPTNPPGCGRWILPAARANIWTDTLILTLRAQWPVSKLTLCNIIWLSHLERYGNDPVLVSICWTLVGSRVGIWSKVPIYYSISESAVLVRAWIQMNLGWIDTESLKGSPQGGQDSVCLHCDVQAHLNTRCTSQDGRPQWTFLIEEVSPSLAGSATSHIFTSVTSF